VRGSGDDFFSPLKLKDCESMEALILVRTESLFFLFGSGIERLHVVFVSGVELKENKNVCSA
jgi:hypothetical protein